MSENYTETERKFIPLNPRKLERFRATAYEIEQPYLSHLDEEYSLRLRKTINQDGTEKLVTTIKDAGTMVEHGLERMEVSAPVSVARYEYYTAEDLPTVRKFRSEPREGIVIDWMRNTSHVQVESENPEAWNNFVQDYGFESDFTDATGQLITDNEWWAHHIYEQKHGGRKAFIMEEELEPREIYERIVRLLGSSAITINIGGRSGSGKTTLMNRVIELLNEDGIQTSSLSTDNYNHGRTHLLEKGGGSWPNLDDIETYNIPLSLEHARQLKRGLIVPRHTFNFHTNEPEISYDDPVIPAPVNFIEGIKAHHPDFSELADLTIILPTMLATSLGRRIKRDRLERPLTAEPKANLENYMEYAEPEYRALL